MNEKWESLQGTLKMKNEEISIYRAQYDNQKEGLSQLIDKNSLLSAEIQQLKSERQQVLDTAAKDKQALLGQIENCAQIGKVQAVQIE